jgi:flavodoxin I
MKVLIIYDSVYGYTEKIALAIAGAMTSPDEARAVRPGGINAADFASYDIIIAGSPTQGGRPIRPVLDFISKLPDNALANKPVTAFDTRMSAKQQNAALRLLMKTIGYAAGRLGDALASKGGKLILPPEGFIVEGREGPLREGEIERAAAWGNTIIAGVK